MSRWEVEGRGVGERQRSSKQTLKRTTREVRQRKYLAADLFAAVRRKPGTQLVSPLRTRVELTEVLASRPAVRLPRQT